ncbi:MAG: 16S rRNA (cytidine1402-2'-O)-methyltransferase [Saprospiraceae bacterium]|jgi:16S rRNA (cytidine1402-2'-O)-methyltransferase
MPKLFLIPCLLAEDGIDHIPPIAVKTIASLDAFVVEGLRTARRFIRKMIPDYNIDGATFVEMDKHDMQVTSKEVALLLKGGKNIGLLSEAGCPCLADPGNKIVDQARAAGYTISPLTGPTSIVSALISSGYNGQQFTFHGYLPFKEPDLGKKLQQLNQTVIKTGYTQIWIETPYRNDKMIEALVKTLPSLTSLTIAIELNSKKEEILKLNLSQWKGKKIGKRPAVFLMGL